MAVKYLCTKCDKRFVDWGADKIKSSGGCADCTGEFLELVGFSAAKSASKKKPTLKRKKSAAAKAKAKPKAKAKAKTKAKATPKPKAKAAPRPKAKAAPKPKAKTVAKKSSKKKVADTAGKSDGAAKKS